MSAYYSEYPCQVLWCKDKKKFRMFWVIYIYIYMSRVMTFCVQMRRYVILEKTHLNKDVIYTNTNNFISALNITECF